jgi:hypothetical protein
MLWYRAVAEAGVVKDVAGLTDDVGLCEAVLKTARTAPVKRGSIQGVDLVRTNARDARMATNRDRVNNL